MGQKVLPKCSQFPGQPGHIGKSCTGQLCIRVSLGKEGILGKEISGENLNGGRICMVSKGGGGGGG